MANDTDLTEFILVGFPGLPQAFHHLVSVTMFLVYTVALSANSTVVLLIALKKHLHQPMYLVISNLALSDLTFDTITLPKTIAMYWFGDRKISFAACMFQDFCVHNLGTFDSLIFMLMAVDRYVALSRPLRYSSIITNKLISILCGLSLLVSSSAGAINVSLVSQLSFCKLNNKIDNCYCHNGALYAVTCADSSSTGRVTLGLALTVLLIPLAFVIFSYIVIIRTVSRSRSSDGWQKAFYTCSTHLFTIGMYYVPRLLIYMFNYFRLIVNADLKVLIPCLYTFVPHLLSPIIYCLRTQDIKRTIENIFKCNQR